MVRLRSPDYEVLAALSEIKSESIAEVASLAIRGYAADQDISSLVATYEERQTKKVEEIKAVLAEFIEPTQD